MKFARAIDSVSEKASLPAYKSLQGSLASTFSGMNVGGKERFSSDGIGEQRAWNIPPKWKSKFRFKSTPTQFVSRRFVDRFFLHNRFWSRKLESRKKTKSIVVEYMMEPNDIDWLWGYQQYITVVWVYS